MTDYLIEQYNSKVVAATDLKQDRIAKATQLWNDAIAESISQWQADTTAAALEMETALEHRNRRFIEGPPPADEEPGGQPLDVDPPPMVADSRPFEGFNGVLRDEPSEHDV